MISSHTHRFTIYQSYTSKKPKSILIESEIMSFEIIFVEAPALIQQGLQSEFLLTGNF